MLVFNGASSSTQQGRGGECDQGTKISKILAFT